MEYSHSLTMPRPIRKKQNKTRKNTEPLKVRLAHDKDNPSSDSEDNLPLKCLIGNKNKSVCQLGEHVTGGLDLTDFEHNKNRQESCSVDTLPEEAMSVRTSKSTSELLMYELCEQHTKDLSLPEHHKNNTCQRDQYSEDNSTHEHHGEHAQLTGKYLDASPIVKQNMSESLGHEQNKTDISVHFSEDAVVFEDKEEYVPSPSYMNDTSVFEHLQNGILVDEEHTDDTELLHGQHLEMTSVPPQNMETLSYEEHIEITFVYEHCDMENTTVSEQNIGDQKPMEGRSEYREHLNDTPVQDKIVRNALAPVQAEASQMNIEKAPVSYSISKQKQLKTSHEESIVMHEETTKDKSMSGIYATLPRTDTADTAQPATDLTVSVQTDTTKPDQTVPIIDPVIVTLDTTVETTIKGLSASQNENTMLCDNFNVQEGSSTMVIQSDKVTLPLNISCPRELGGTTQTLSNTKQKTHTQSDIDSPDNLGSLLDDDDEKDLIPLAEYAKQLLESPKSLDLNDNVYFTSSPSESTVTVSTKTNKTTGFRNQAKRKAKEIAMKEIGDLSFSDDSSGTEYEPPDKKRLCSTESSDSELDVNDSVEDIILLPKTARRVSSSRDPPMVPSNQKQSKGNKNERKSRVRKRNPEMWKSQIRKRLRNEGKEYVNTRGKRVPMKTCETSSFCKCKYKCKNIGEEARQSVFGAYWKLGYERQRDFIKQHVTKNDKRRQTKKCQESRRQNTLEYFLPVGDEKLQVCKKTFLAILSIGEKTVHYTLAKRTSLHSKDKRGRSVPINKIPEEDRECIRSHIRSFPKVPSHYCRSTSQREYLSCDLSVNKMYQLYVLKCKSQNRIPLKRHIYGYMFRNEFNLGFHVPKKDACAFCSAFEKMPEQEQHLNERKYDDHLRRKIEARERKASDKLVAQTNEGITLLNFDLQKVLITPKCAVSDFYYSRKLATYNFSVYNLISKDVVCFMWNETVAKRGSCEIASCMYNYNKGLGAKDEVIYYSDSCTGQQRNLHFSVMCLYCVTNLPINRITHNYFERGHSQMEGDSVHAVIERATKHSTLYTSDEWMTAVRNSKQQEPKYDVVEVNRKFVKDFKRISELGVSNRVKADDGTKLQWNKVHSFQYKKSDPHRIFYKYEIGEESYRSLNITRISARSFRPVSLKGVSLNNMYASPLPISEAKFKDLIQLCDKGLIPPHCQMFYRNLPHNDSIKERLPQPDEEDTSESDE